MKIHHVNTSCKKGTVPNKGGMTWGTIWHVCEVEYWGWNTIITVTGSYIPGHKVRLSILIRLENKILYLLKIFTSLCSVLASPFSFDCGLDGEYDLERERDRLRDILNVIKSERYFRNIHKFILEVRSVP